MVVLTNSPQPGSSDLACQSVAVTASLVLVHLCVAGTVWTHHLSCGVWL